MLGCVADATGSNEKFFTLFVNRWCSVTVCAGTFKYSLAIIDTGHLVKNALWVSRRRLSRKICNYFQCC